MKMKPEINRTIEERLEQIEKDLNQIKLMFINHLFNNTKTQSNEESLLNVKDVSSFLKVHNRIIYAACSKGELPLLRLGNHISLKKTMF